MIHTIAHCIFDAMLAAEQTRQTIGPPYGPGSVEVTIRPGRFPRVKIVRFGEPDYLDFPILGSPSTDDIIAYLVETEYLA